MIDSEAMLQELKAGIGSIIKDSAAQYAKQAQSDIDDFLASAKPLLTEWGIELNSGKMTKDQFEFLAAGKLNDLVQLKALTQAGIAAATLDSAREKVVNFAIVVVSKSL